MADTVDDLLLVALGYHRRHMSDASAAEQLCGAAPGRSALRAALARVQAVMEASGTHPELEAVERIVALALRGPADSFETRESLEIPAWLRRRGRDSGRVLDVSKSPLVRRVFGHVPEVVVDIPGLERDLERLRETAPPDDARRRRWIRA